MLINLPAPLLENYSWQLEGRCRDYDPEMFYYKDKERGSTKHKKNVAAKRVCAACPVIAQCREHALAGPEVFGIWGGLTEKDRQQILHTNFRR